MVPMVHGGSGMAYKADVTGAQASPLSNEVFSVMRRRAIATSSCGCRTASQVGLYCADETDGEALRACEQVNESLYAL